MKNEEKQNHFSVAVLTFQSLRKEGWETSGCQPPFCFLEAVQVFEYCLDFGSWEAFVVLTIFSVLSPETKWFVPFIPDYFRLEYLCR